MQPAVVWDRSGVRRPSSEARLVPYPVLGSRRRALLCTVCPVETRSPAAGASWSRVPRLTAAVEGFSGLSGTAIASHLHAIATANGS